LRWPRCKTGQFTQPAFEQDPTFYYFTGTDRLLGAILVLDGKTRRTELFVPPALPGFLGPIANHQPTAAAINAAAVHVDGVADWSAFSRYIQRRISEQPSLSIQVDGDVTREGLAGWVGIALDSLATLSRPRSTWLDALRQRWPNARVVPSAGIPDEQRGVRTPSRS
jgi:hypothetical protein